MTISQVALTNTFGEFRTTFNDAANVINYLDTTILTGTLTVNTSASITGTTESTSTTTGSLKTAGGLGVVKNVYVGGIVDVSNTTQSTSVSSGALIVDGGAGIAKNLYVGGIVDVTDTTQSTSVTTGALIVDGGAGVAKNMYVGGDMQVTGNLTILGSNTSLSTTQIVIEDNILQLSHLNSADLIDIGFIGGYNNGANVHSGLFRDASDGTWKFFKDYDIEPGTTINISGNGFAFANVQAGNVTATKFSGDGSSLTGAGATLTNDTSSNTSYYVNMANTTSGIQTTSFISTSKLYFNPSTGTLNATNFNSLSDVAFKENIVGISSPMEIVNKLSGVEFNWKDNGTKGYGFIAQEIEKVLPEIVSTNEKGDKSVNYSSIIPFLIECVKDLSEKVKTLEDDRKK